MSADVRRCGVNLNYWWPVAHESTIPRSGIQAARLGTLELVILRSVPGHFGVFEDACPHKRVRISRFGVRRKGELVCAYHGWRFDPATGGCTSVGSMPGRPEKICLRAYPVRTYGGWVWAFPGEPERMERAPFPTVPPAERPETHYRIPMEGIVNCHFSYITENATDLFHAELHRAQQPWANPRLASLERDARTVHAVYAVDTPRAAALLFGGKGEKRVHVVYEYPYVRIYEERGAFYLFVVYLPTGPQETYVHSTFYFPRIIRIEWLSRLLLPIAEPLVTYFLNQGTFRKVFMQDIRAVEEEQRAYNLRGEDRSLETNPVSHAVRQVIRIQTAGQPSVAEEPRVLHPGRTR